MKKYIYIICFSCLLGSGVHAQVLWSDDFDNYTLGNLGVINIIYNPNKVFSQGNWLLSEVPHTNSTAPAFQATIEAETGRGNVLKIQDIPLSNTPLSMHAPNLYATKEIPDLDTLWSNRTAGNDILKYEGEFYIAFEGRLLPPPSLNIGVSRIESNDTIQYNIPSPLEIGYSGSTMEVIASASGTGFPGAFHTPMSNWIWIKVIIYVDYTTGFVYFEIPSVNTAYRSSNPLPSHYFKVFNLLQLAFVSDAASNNGNRPPNFVKFDNFKVSAVNTLPLSLQKLASATFSIFPNPVTDVVTITNSDNIGVEQIEFFDISGKKVQSQNFNNENEVQLNLGDFAAGTYLLHIKTNAGIAVEKIVKK